MKDVFSEVTLLMILSSSIFVSCRNDRKNLQLKV